LNSNNGKIQFVFLLVICCNIFLEKSCHAQFHWAKSGRREANLLKELLHDLAMEDEESDNGSGVKRASSEDTSTFLRYVPYFKPLNNYVRSRERRETEGKSRRILNCKPVGPMSLFSRCSWQYTK